MLQSKTLIYWFIFLILYLILGEYITLVNMLT